VLVGLSAGEARARTLGKHEPAYGDGGGDEGTRTPNPRLAKAVRYQLRHVPEWG
jgi:hypothetical protein